MKRIHLVRSRHAKNRGNLRGICTIRNWDKLRNYLHTPAPLTKRHKRFKASPRCPRENVVTTPESKTDSGHNTAMPKRVARSLSSGTQSLPRIFRHLITTRSEMRPLMTLPAWGWSEVSKIGSLKIFGTYKCCQGPRVGSRLQWLLHWWCYTFVPGGKVSTAGCFFYVCFFTIV